MNYCDDYGNCRQGRDCPARSKTCPHCFGIGYDASGYACTCVTAKVAKVGRRMHGPKPLQGSQWRGHLKDLARVALLTIAVMLVSGLTVALVR